MPARAARNASISSAPVARPIETRKAPRLANTTFFAIPGVKAETAQIA
ncbi:MAG: cysteine desulfurase, partial [Mesorhizobium sp.]